MKRFAVIATLLLAMPLALHAAEKAPINLNRSAHQQAAHTASRQMAQEFFLNANSVTQTNTAKQAARTTDALPTDTMFARVVTPYLNRLPVRDSLISVLKKYKPKASPSDDDDDDHGQHDDDDDHGHNGKHDDDGPNKK